MKPYINLRLTLISVFVYALLFSVSSCKKEEDCEKEGYGYFKFENNQPARYDIYVQGFDKVYAFANDVGSLTLPNGYYNVKVKHFQAKDSMEGSILIKPCETVKWSN